MDCELAGRLIRAHLDGELEEARARELERHLAGCEDCRRRREEDRRISAAIRSAAPAFARRPEVLEPQCLRRRLGRARADEATLVRMLRRVAAAAAVLVISSGFAIGWAEARGRQTPGEATSFKAVAVTAGEGRLEPLLDDESSIIVILGEQWRDG